MPEIYLELITEYHPHTEKNMQKKNIIVTTMIEKCHIMVRLMVVITIFMIVITILWLL